VGGRPAIFDQSSINVFVILILSEKGVAVAVKFRPEVFRDSRSWGEACSASRRLVNIFFGGWGLFMIETGGGGNKEILT
jgi:hypothetical protein